LFPEDEADQRFLAERYFSAGKIPGMQISVKQAVKLVQDPPETIRMEIRQEDETLTFHNVVAEIPGRKAEWIVCTAHYDTTSLSIGSYDNMTGCIALLEILERLQATAPNNYGVRVVFCSGEEEDLLGSRAYLTRHEEEISKMVLNINIDMIGSIMGGFLACCSAEEALASHIRYLALEAGWGIKVKNDVYSSDSTSFADKGIPAVTFARMPSGNYFSIHSRHDTAAVLSLAQIQKDIRYIADFTDRMANAVKCPVKREIPEKIKKLLDEYMERKRPEEK
ncbi:MAG: Zn-dependent exopeptidase M28, partial [Firmicutes bacterium]|nr:Zn-dependent exopeptidase M28 [Bacillota bacterium]